MNPLEISADLTDEIDRLHAQLVAANAQISNLEKELSRNFRGEIQAKAQLSDAQAEIVRLKKQLADESFGHGPTIGDRHEMGG